MPLLVKLLPACVDSRCLLAASSAAWSELFPVGFDAAKFLAVGMVAAVWRLCLVRGSLAFWCPQSVLGFVGRVCFLAACGSSVMPAEVLCKMCAYSRLRLAVLLLVTERSMLCGQAGVWVFFFCTALVGFGDPRRPRAAAFLSCVFGARILPAPCLAAVVLCVQQGSRVGGCECLESTTGGRACGGTRAGRCRDTGSHAMTAVGSGAEGRWVGRGRFGGVRCAASGVQGRRVPE